MQGKNPDVVAKISILGSKKERFAWTVTVGNADKVGEKCDTPTEALWRAVDDIREDPMIGGRVMVFSPEGDRIAVVPLWAVPQYECLPWESICEPLDLVRMARDLDNSIQEST